MYEIEFFEDAKGYSEIVTYIKDLEKRSKSNKECRVNYNKIIAYFDLLQEYGVMIGEPMTKHIEGEIWELRPLRNRFLYAYYDEGTFVVLHYFIKKTQKTPRRELERAKRNLEIYRSRRESNGNMEKTAE